MIPIVPWDAPIKVIPGNREYRLVIYYLPCLFPLIVRPQSSAFPLLIHRGYRDLILLSHVTLAPQFNWPVGFGPVLLQSMRLDCPGRHCFMRGQNSGRRVTTSPSYLLACRNYETRWR